MLTREQILNQKLREEKMTIPELGDDILIRELTLKQRVDCHRAGQDGGKTDPLRFTIAVFIEGVVEPKFTAADLDALQKQGGRIIDRVATRILEMSGFGADAKKE